MKIFRKASELEPNLVSIKDKGQSIGLVLTMGNLHDGHLSLIREAQLHNEFVICSILLILLNLTMKMISILIQRQLMKIFLN